MDYQNYDNDTNDSDADYFAFVAWLSDLTAVELREAKPNQAQQKKALCRYYKRGENAHMTVGELVDFLAVSTPSILDKAGYTDEEGTALMEISDRITDDDIRETGLPDAL